MESPISVSPRAGHLLRRPAGHTTFEPASLPPEGLHVNGALHRVLSAADLKLGYLLGQAAARPQSASLVAMACRREAVASCRLEGSTVTLKDLLWFELDGVRADTLSCPPGEVRVCLNYAAILLEDTEEVADATPVLRASIEVFVAAMSAVATYAMQRSGSDPEEVRCKQRTMCRPHPNTSRSTWPDWWSSPWTMQLCRRWRAWRSSSVNWSPSTPLLMVVVVSPV